ncbi:MAG: zinc-binding alcohol dehydrogenase [Erysipelotrichaceae bacterium]|nr:zinc-binding alcohol dehydrogenase [Erysipelotrichaceae bacterium]
MMKSFYVNLTGINESSIYEEQIDTSNLKDNEAIIKANYSMISAGTELSRAFGLKKGFEYPVRPGYCMVGTILEKGKDVEADVGDKVFVNAPHASLVRRSTGNNPQGPLIIKLPEGIDEKDATAINLLLVAIQGVNLTEVKLGNTVGVFGLGNIGIITALMYKKLGCKVIGLDPVSERCDLAKQMGLEYVIDSNNQKDEINKLTDNKGLDIAVDVTGVAQSIISTIDNTKAYGQVLLLGSPRTSYETDVMPVFSNIHMKNLKVIGGFNKTTPVYCEPGSNNSLINNFYTVCDLIKNKDIDISKLISKVIDPKDCQQAYYDLMYNKDKVNCIVFDWNNY